MATGARTSSSAYPELATNHEGEATTSRRTARPVRRLSALGLHPLELVLIAGLAGVFLVNAAVAIVEPSEIRELVRRSIMGRSLDVMNGRWVAWAVAVNDVAIGTALLATPWAARARPYVLAWAGAWLLGVALIKLTSVEGLGG